MPNSKIKYSIAGNALIFNEKGEILLAHRTDMDRWNFPGGGMEPGETPVQTTIREAKEEIGVDVEIVKLLGVYTKVDEDDVIFAFICKIVNGIPGLSDEADDVKYFSLNKIPTNISRFQRERIIDAAKNSDEIIFKTQIHNN